MLNCKRQMTITAAEYFDSFPDMGRKNAEVQLQEAIRSFMGQVDRSQDDAKREEFRWISIGHSTLKGEAKAPNNLF